MRRQEGHAPSVPTHLDCRVEQLLICLHRLHHAHQSQVVVCYTHTPAHVMHISPMHKLRLRSSAYFTPKIRGEVL